MRASSPCEMDNDSYAALALHELWYSMCYDVSAAAAAAVSGAMATHPTTPDPTSTMEMEEEGEREERERETGLTSGKFPQHPKRSNIQDEDQMKSLGVDHGPEATAKPEVATSRLRMDDFPPQNPDPVLSPDGVLHLTNMLILLERLEEFRIRNEALERKCAFLLELQSLVTYRNASIQAELRSRQHRNNRNQTPKRGGPTRSISCTRTGSESQSQFFDGEETGSARDSATPRLDLIVRRNQDVVESGGEMRTSTLKTSKWERKKSKKLQAKWEQVKKVFTSGRAEPLTSMTSNRVIESESSSSHPKNKEKPPNRNLKRMTLNNDLLDALRSTMIPDGKDEQEVDLEDPGGSPCSVKSEPTAGAEDEKERSDGGVWITSGHLDQPHPKLDSLRRSFSIDPKVINAEEELKTRTQPPKEEEEEEEEEARFVFPTVFAATNPEPEVRSRHSGHWSGSSFEVIPNIPRSRSFKDTPRSSPGGADNPESSLSISLPSSPVDLLDHDLGMTSASIHVHLYGAEAGKKARAAWDKVKVMIHTRRESFKLKGQKVGGEGHGQRKKTESHAEGGSDVITIDDSATGSQSSVSPHKPPQRRFEGSSQVVAIRQMSPSPNRKVKGQLADVRGREKSPSPTSQTVARQQNNGCDAQKAPTTQPLKSANDEEVTSRRSTQKEKSEKFGRRRNKNRPIGRAKSVDTSVVKFSDDFISKMEKWEEKQRLNESNHPLRKKSNSESLSTECPRDLGIPVPELKEQLSESFSKTVESWQLVRGGRAKSREGRSREKEQSPRSRDRAKSDQRVEKELQKLGKKEQKLENELQKLTEIKQKLETSARENKGQESSDKVKDSDKVIKPPGKGKEIDKFKSTETAKTEHEDNVKDNAKDNIKGIIKVTVKNTAKDTAKDNANDNATDNAKDNVKDNFKDSFKDSAKDSAKDNLKDIVQDNAKDNIKNNAKSNAKNNTKYNVKDNAKDNTKDVMKAKDSSEVQGSQKVKEAEKPRDMEKVDGRDSENKTDNDGVGKPGKSGNSTEAKSGNDEPPSGHSKNEVDSDGTNSRLPEDLGKVKPSTDSDNSTGEFSENSRSGNEDLLALYKPNFVLGEAPRNGHTPIEGDSQSGNRRKEVNDLVKRLEQELQAKDEMMTSLDRKIADLQSQILQLRFENIKKEGLDLIEVPTASGTPASSLSAFTQTEEWSQSTRSTTHSAVSTSTNAIVVTTCTLSTNPISSSSTDVTTTIDACLLSTNATDSEAVSTKETSTITLDTSTVNSSSTFGIKDHRTSDSTDDVKSTNVQSASAVSETASSADIDGTEGSKISTSSVSTIADSTKTVSTSRNHTGTTSADVCGTFTIGTRSPGTRGVDGKPSPVPRSNSVDISNSNSSYAGVKVMHQFAKVNHLRMLHLVGFPGAGGRRRHSTDSNTTTSSPSSPSSASITPSAFYPVRQSEKTRSDNHVTPSSSSSSPVTSFNARKFKAVVVVGSEERRNDDVIKPAERTQKPTVEVPNGTCSTSTSNNTHNNTSIINIISNTNSTNTSSNISASFNIQTCSTTTNTSNTTSTITSTSSNTNLNSETSTSTNTSSSTNAAAGTAKPEVVPVADWTPNQDIRCQQQRRHSEDKKWYEGLESTRKSEVDGGPSIGFTTLPRCRRRRWGGVDPLHPDDDDDASGASLPRPSPPVRGFPLLKSQSPLFVLRSLKTAAELMAASEMRRQQQQQQQHHHHNHHHRSRPNSEKFPKRQRRYERDEDTPETKDDQDSPPSDPVESLEFHQVETAAVDPDSSSPWTWMQETSGSVEGSVPSSVNPESPLHPREPQSTSRKVAFSPDVSDTVSMRTGAGQGHRRSKQNPNSKWETTFLVAGSDSKTNFSDSDSNQKTRTNRTQTVSFDLGEDKTTTGERGASPPRPVGALGAPGAQGAAREGPGTQQPPKAKTKFLEGSWFSKSKKFFKTSKQW